VLKLLIANWYTAELKLDAFAFDTPLILLPYHP
jgi:hypothetical protein